MPKSIVHALLLICLVLAPGCARLPVTFTVLDAETRNPIEEAVAIAWWTSYKGGWSGLGHSETEKVVELQSDMNGTFKIPATYGWTALQRPRIKIYKPGYVGWDNRYVYLGHWKNDIRISREKKRKDFKYKSQEIYLEPWKDEYSYISHDSFLTMHVPGDLHRVGLHELKYEKAIRYEVPFITNELKLLNQKAIK